MDFFPAGTGSHLNGLEQEGDALGSTAAGWRRVWGRKGDTDISVRRLCIVKRRSNRAVTGARRRTARAPRGVAGQGKEE